MGNVNGKDKSKYNAQGSKLTPKHWRPKTKHSLLNTNEAGNIQNKLKQCLQNHGCIYLCKTEKRWKNAK